MTSKRGQGKRRRLLGTVTATLQIFLFTVSLTWATPPAQRDSADNLEVHVGKTVEITSSHRYCWFPTIHRFKTGAIMVTMQMGPDEVNPEGEFTAYCISKDGGLTWSRRYTMGAGASADGAYSAEPEKDGSISQLHNYPLSYPSNQAVQFHTALTKFYRGGIEFKQIRDAVIRLAQPAYMAPVSLFDRQTTDGKVKKQIRGMPWGPIIHALNGDLLAPFYYKAANDPRYYRTVLLRSSDKGQTWKEYSTIAAIGQDDQPWPWMGKEGPCEPGLVRLADKRLCVVFRTGSNGYAGETWSDNDGKTWTRPVSTGFKGVAIRMRRLSNGILALTTGRPGPVVIMFSVDGTGKYWSHVTPIFSGMSTRYTDFIEVQPGKLFVVYDSVPYGWYPIPFADRTSRNVIYGTFVKVRRK